jgi:hypothetical protein
VVGCKYLDIKKREREKKGRKKEKKEERKERRKEGQVFFPHILV